MQKLPRKDKIPEPHDDEFDVHFVNLDEKSYDFVGNDKDGNWFYIDPFVGCAWQYTHRNDLVGKTARVRGFWNTEKKNSVPVFIVNENGITNLQDFIAAPQQP